MRKPRIDIAIALAFAGGCAFTTENRPGAGGADDGADPGALCDPNDATLRLCVDFEAPLVDVVAELSAQGLEAVFGDVGTMDHDSERAGMFTPVSTAHVLEWDTLDITGDLALDMWIRPLGILPGPGRYTMLDNHGQYSALLNDRKVRCVFGTKDVESPPLPPDVGWHHIGCTYDTHVMKVFVDGKLVKCHNEMAAIPTDGMAGLALGARLDGTNVAPTYSERFTGGLDDVRVWARSDVDMCAAAGATGCVATCPPGP